MIVSKWAVSVALHDKPAVKRSIGHNLNIRFGLMDVAGIWQKLVDAAVDGKIATADNVDSVNAALVLQTVKLQELADLVNNEYVWFGRC